MNGFSADAYFYMGRDTLLGLNGRTRSTERGLRLLDKAVKRTDLSERLREEAEWFTSLSFATDISLRGQCVRMIPNVFEDNFNHTIIWDAAAEGYPLAMGYIASHYASRSYLDEACMAGEPVALSFIDLQRASKFGHIASAQLCRYREGGPTLADIIHVINTLIQSGEEIPYNTRVLLVNYFNQKDIVDIYKCGSLLYKHKDIYDSISEFINPRMNIIVNYYINCHVDTTNAVKVWLLFSRFRLGFYSDLRRMVANAIWKLRFDWNEL